MPRWSNVYPGHFYRGLVPLHETNEKCRVHQYVHGVVGQGLDYIGRVQIIKTFITSLFQYSISAVDIPETYIKEVASVIYAIVWKDKKERLKRRVLIKNKEEGGPKVPTFKFIVDSVKLKCFL